MRFTPLKPEAVGFAFVALTMGRNRCLDCMRFFSPLWLAGLQAGVCDSMPVCYFSLGEKQKKQRSWNGT